MATNKPEMLLRNVKSKIRSAVSEYKAHVLHAIVDRSSILVFGREISPIYFLADLLDGQNLVRGMLLQPQASRLNMANAACSTTTANTKSGRGIGR